MKTTELKKGQRIKLRNGWEADVLSDIRTTTPVCMVYGFETEAGSVYDFDICFYKEDGKWLPVEHTEKQLKRMKQVHAMGF